MQRFTFEISNFASSIYMTLCTLIKMEKTDLVSKSPSMQLSFISAWSEKSNFQSQQFAKFLLKKLSMPSGKQHLQKLSLC